jgi:hypothetical protein
MHNKQHLGSKQQQHHLHGLKAVMHSFCPGMPLLLPSMQLPGSSSMSLASSFRPSTPVEIKRLYLPGLLVHAAKMVQGDPRCSCRGLEGLSITPAAAISWQHKHDMCIKVRFAKLNSQVLAWLSLRATHPRRAGASARER